MFWDVLHEMTPMEKSMFLRFCSARSRLPTSFGDMTFKLEKYTPRFDKTTKLQVDPDLDLPFAQTCFFNLRVPTYSTKQILRNKLMYAITQALTMDSLN